MKRHHLPRYAGILFGMLQAFLPASLSADVPGQLGPFFEKHCIDCHEGAQAEGGLDLLSLKWSPEDSHNESIWVKIYDRVVSEEMPPEEASELSDADREVMAKDLSQRLIETREKAYAQNGRAVSRRVNRFEYENILRDLLHDPYLKIADQLPLDGEVHGFAKVGDALDVSHVQVDAYLDAAEFALRRALEFPAEKPRPTTNRYYAREEGRMWAGGGNGGWARFSLALEGLDINEEYSFNKRGFDPARKAGKIQSVGITVDDTEAERTGSWRKSTRRSNHVGAHYLADDNKNTGAYAITWKATLPKPGIYEVRVSNGGGEGLARKAPYRVGHAEGETRLTIDQSQEPTIQGLWYPLGSFTFGADPKTEPVVAEVSLSNKDARGWVIAVAVQFVHLDDLSENKDGNPTRKRGTPESLANAPGDQTTPDVEDASTAIFRGAYTPFYYGFERFKAPVRGNYKLRLKARSVLRTTDYVDWEGEKKPRH